MRWCTSWLNTYPADVVEVEWITVREAADILGVHMSAVPKMIRRGDLKPREKRPKLLRSEVVALADRRTEQSAARVARRASRGHAPQPPDTAHDWLLVAPAAAVLNLSAGTLSNRVSQGRVPCTVHDHRRWFRLDLLEQIVRARHVERVMDDRVKLMRQE